MLIPAACRRGCGSPLSGDGFTIVESLTVCAVIVLLLVAITPRFIGARRGNEHRMLAGVVRSYDEAASEFARAHTGRPPVLGDARDWPLDENGTAATGPIGRDGTRYLRGGVQEEVRSGQVLVVAIGNPDQGTVGTITYERIGGSSYRLVAAATRDGDTWTCSAGGPGIEETCR